MTPRELPVLRSERLVLRPREARDAEALHPLFADVEAMRYWSGPPHRDVAETLASFDRNEPAWRVWAITTPANDHAIGFVAAGEDWKGNVTEIGYMLGRAHWGGGIAQEAVGTVIDRIFAEGQRRVYADTDPDNTPSRAMLERLGFKLEGILRAEWETHIGVRDTALYGLLAGEWSAGRADQVERARDEVVEG
ncbi:GNAT family protein [Sphingomonas sp. Y38-1Y]|uniref:GNAT family N-acetyltransferase n=1 Tax=Sphingomonas sp. Y38-1Y TaxID=3078265 RepID=UPI0028EA9500|nr:GNAT family protein [Sphingomonas sp. Y38-1Y]